MRNSKLENAPNKLIYTICKKILNKVEDDWDQVFDSSLYTADVYGQYERVLKVVGFSETIDVDFIYNVIKLNIIELDNSDTEIELIRPSFSKYDQIVEVNETVFQITTYSIPIDSYSDSPNGVSERFQFEEEQGWKSIWDGKEVDVHRHDSETSDISYVRVEKRD